MTNQIAGTTTSEDKELFTPGYRRWALPMLRALDAMGGSGTPMAVEDRVRAILKDHLNDRQWARVLRGNYIRWARHMFKKAGLIGGQKGVWEITPAGRAWLAARENEPIEANWDVAELSLEEAANLKAPLETVDATDFEGYEIPLLRLLEPGPQNKTELFDRLKGSLEAQLLPGDYRIMPRGRTVWFYRASWALTNLKKSGAIRNPSVARWELTDTGRTRLAQEAAGWRVEQFRGSKAKVRGNSEPHLGAISSKGSGWVWPTSTWKSFAAEFPEIAATLERRLRPDLTPTSDTAVARNVIFYGPPGTGKTFVAKHAATALTGDDEPGVESAWRLVQFHPSYAYEDFVQGLRPALDVKELRYKLHQGPFLQICKAAEDDPDRFHVLIIDEINRGDPARIFGELLYALEYRDETIELASGGSLVVPSNLIILGTMNSVDRSVALVDHALRRRFAFVRVDPTPEAIEDPRLGELLAQFNEWLVTQLDADHAIGHSIFLNVALVGVPTDEAIERVWVHDVRPLLEEYFFGQSDRLKAAEIAWRQAKEATDDEDERGDAGPRS